MTKKSQKTLSKKTGSVKWPLNKFLNKFTIYNIFETVGIAMLILSIVCKSAFDGDNGKIVGNIIASALVTIVGLGGGIIYSLLLKNKGEKPFDTKFSKITQMFFWVPVVGIVFNQIWKAREKKFIYQHKLKENPEFKKPRMFLPNSISLIMLALVLIVFVVWILYLSGVNLEVKNTEGFWVKGTVPGILDIFLNPIRGFGGYKSTNLGQVNGVGSLVIFLLIFNATMTLVNDSRSLEAGIGALLRKMNGREIILIPVLMAILAICGSTFNMCEQLLPLFLVVIPIMFAAGFDAMTGFLVVFMSAGVGVLGSTVNPVLIGTAVDALKNQGITVALMDGIVWRLVIFAAVTLTAILCTVFYAKKVRTSPKKSCVYMSQDAFKSKYTFDKDALPPMTKKRMWTLIVFGVAFLMLIVGFIDWHAITGWDGFIKGQAWLAANFPFLTSITPLGSFGMLEGGFIFFLAAIIIGVINWKGMNHFFNTFYQGCREFIGVAFIVAVAKGLAITLNESGFNNMIANGLGSMLGKVPAVVGILLVFLVTCLLTIFVPSSSGLSSAMMPVIGPAIASVGTISVSGSVTAFAAGMGFVNLFTPTGMVLPFLEVSKMELPDFAKAAWKHILIILVVTVALLVVGNYLPGSLF